jgi:hypothetical protein
MKCIEKVKLHLTEANRHLPTGEHNFLEPWSFLALSCSGYFSAA